MGVEHLTEVGAELGDEGVVVKPRRPFRPDMLKTQGFVVADPQLRAVDGVAVGSFVLLARHEIQRQGRLRVLGEIVAQIGGGVGASPPPRARRPPSCMVLAYLGKKSMVMKSAPSA